MPKLLATNGLQTGSLQMTAGQNSVTVPITPVTRSKAAIFMSYSSPEAGLSNGSVRGRLAATDDGIVFARQGTTGVVDINWAVLQSDDWVVQHGTKADAAASGVYTETLPTPVSALDRVVVMASYTVGLSRVRLTATNTLEFNTQATHTSMVIDWQVIEFLDATTIQYGLASTHALGTDVNISAVDPTKALLLFNHSTGAFNVSNVDRWGLRGFFNSTTQLRFQRRAIEGNTGTAREFQAAWWVIQSDDFFVQTVNATLAATEATKTHALGTAVDLTRTFVQAGGSRRTGEASLSTATFSEAQARIRLTDTSTVEVTRGTSSDEAQFSAFVVQVAVDGAVPGQVVGATAVEVFGNYARNTDDALTEAAILDALATAGDGVWVRSPTNPNATVLEVSLASVLSADGRFVRYEYGKGVDNVRQVNQTAQLRSPDGLTLVREWVHTNVAVRPISAEHDISDLTVSGQHRVRFIDTVV
jgi:hypothetical protein